MTRREALGAGLGAAAWRRGAARRPNFVLILTDDQRHDAMGCAGNRHIETPAMDSIARRGVRFSQAAVTMSVCAASRAAILTGRYGSRNGVQSLDAALRAGETTISEMLARAGYLNGYAGKWHLDPPRSPEEAGFEFSSWFYSNGAHFDRQVTEQGKRKTAAGFVEDWVAGQCVHFLEQAARQERPFFLHYSPQLPHLDHEFRWNASKETLARYHAAALPVPRSWDDPLTGKPEYLRECRNRTQGMKYGYDSQERIRQHKKEYYAAITELDRRIGVVLEALKRLRLEEETYVMLMGDNGWLLGEHGFTSKVLAYEESMRVPLVAAGPGIRRGQRDELVLNVDLFPTWCELAGLTPVARIHGRSLCSLFQGQGNGWRKEVLYECLKSELGAKPALALRSREWKFIQTLSEDGKERVEFEELYDLREDSEELHNLAGKVGQQRRVSEMRGRLAALRGEL